MPDQSVPDSPAGVRVMTPDEEEARNMARAMASSTAGGILRIFQGRELTASDIGDALNIPIPTVMYHLDALLEVGLIEVSRIRYSVKGREVKVYRQSDKVFIVAPRQADIREALLKYASLFGLTILTAGISSILSGIWDSDVTFSEIGLHRAVKEKSMFAAVANSPAEALTDQAVGGNTLFVTPPTFELFGFCVPDIAIGIIIGGSLIIGALIFLDIAAWRKKGKQQGINKPVN